MFSLLSTTAPDYDYNGIYINDRFILTWRPFRDSNNSVYFEYTTYLDEDDPNPDNIWIAFAFSNDRLMVDIYFPSF
jgi:hypothetical protein